MPEDSGDDGFARATRQFTDDEWRRYNNRLVNAAVLVGLGGLLAAIGFHHGFHALNVETAGQWMKIDMEPGFLAFQFLTAFGVTVAVAGKLQYEAAQRTRNLALANRPLPGDGGYDA